MMNYLSAVKFGRISMNRVQVMNFLVTNSVAVPVNIILVPVLLYALTLLYMVKSYVTLLMREFAIPDGGSDTWQP